MTRCWLALLDGAGGRRDRTGRGRTMPTARPAGWLAAWRQRAKPVRAARRVDDRIVDPDGEPAWVSLVLPPDGVRLAFDDLAVQQARRRVLAEPPQDARVHADARRIALRRGDHGRARRGRGTARATTRSRGSSRRAILRVGAGVLGAAAAPAGPTIERYGSANPWPWDRFDTHAP